MNKQQIIADIETPFLRNDLTTFEVGDTVDVHCKIVEGQKQRIQVFTGTVIQVRGTGLTRMFTVRKLVNNEGVERIFPLHSPTIEKIDVRRGGYVRRAKLFYLRDRVGKATRLKEKKVKIEPKAAKQAELTASA